MTDRSAIIDRGVVYPAKALSRDNFHVIIEHIDEWERFEIKFNLLELLKGRVPAKCPLHLQAPAWGSPLESEALPGPRRLQAMASDMVEVNWSEGGIPGVIIHSGGPIQISAWWKICRPRARRVARMAHLVLIVDPGDVETIIREWPNKPPGAVAPLARDRQVDRGGPRDLHEEWAHMRQWIADGDAELVSREGGVKGIANRIANRIVEEYRR